MSSYSYTIISLLFLASSFVSFFVAFIAWQKRRERGAKEIISVMIASGLYAFSLIFETAASTVELKLLWSKIGYFGGLVTPLFYLFFVLRFVGKDKFLKINYVLLFFIIPVLVYILALTNELHHLIWTGYSAISPKTNLMEYYHGEVFWIGHVGYSYILFAVATYSLIRFMVTHLTAFKLEAKIVLSASICPWVASLFYVTGNSIVPGLDLVPFAMILTGTLLTVSIFNNKFLDLVPVARETLMESLEEGILVVDFNDRIQDINKSAKKYLGLPNKDLIGTDFKVIEIKDESFRYIILNRELKQTIKIQDGKLIRHYVIDKYNIANHPGSRLVVIRDYTEDVKREQKLILALEKAEESDKLKSSFLANISHEIRTPLNIITGFIDILQTSQVNEEDRDKYLELLKENSSRIINTLNDIVEISKIESGQIQLEEIQTNLNETIDYLYSLHSKVASDKNVALTCVKGLKGMDIIVNIDRAKLTTVISNLINNALKFTLEGSVEFGYNLEEDKLTFYVQDTGIGISKERQTIIFKQFVQAEQSMNRTYEGTGLGLSIVKHYVSVMGGQIMVKSDVGKGSRFYFSLKYKPVVFPVNLKNIL